MRDRRKLSFDATTFSCHSSCFHSRDTTSQHKTCMYGGVLEIKINGNRLVWNTGNEWGVGRWGGGHVICVLLELRQCTTLSRQVADSWREKRFYEEGTEEGKPLRSSWHREQVVNHVIRGRWAKPEGRKPLAPQNVQQMWEWMWTQIHFTSGGNKTARRQAHLEEAAFFTRALLFKGLFELETDDTRY